MFKKLVLATCVGLAAIKAIDAEYDVCIGTDGEDRGMPVKTSEKMAALEDKFTMTKDIIERPESRNIVGDIAVAIGVGLAIVGCGMKMSSGKLKIGEIDKSTLRKMGVTVIGAGGTIIATSYVK